MIDWKPLLSRWSMELMATDLADTVIPPPDSQGWLGYSPATESDVEALEGRLGVRLPPSYRSFLLTSNGWRSLDLFIQHVLPAEEVDWFRVENEAWIQAYTAPAEDGLSLDLADEEYFHYEQSGSEHIRTEHLASMLQVSDVGDGVLLLNPEAVTSDGEWEAWFFANWLAGAQRFPSFAHLIWSRYLSFRRLQHIPGPAPDPPMLTSPAPSEPRVRAKLSRRRASKSLDFESLVSLLRSTQKKTRDRAVRIFHGKLKGRVLGRRRPDLIASLTDLFSSSNDASVRATCIAGLIEFADDASRPAPFLEGLSDPDGGVVMTAASALAYFSDARAFEPLLRFVASTTNPTYLGSTIHYLGEFGDPRAVPVLCNILLNGDHLDQMSSVSPALALARCGPDGIGCLIDALKSPRADVRFAGVVGLSQTGDIGVIQHLRALLTDPDAQVRSRTEMAIWELEGRGGTP